MLGGSSTAPWNWVPLLAGAMAYAYGVHALRLRNRRWSPWRSLSYACGLFSIAVALVSPLAAHEKLFPVHMVQHMLLGMLGPLFLAYKGTEEGGPAAAHPAGLGPG